MNPKSPNSRLYDLAIAAKAGKFSSNAALAAQFVNEPDFWSKLHGAATAAVKRFGRDITMVEDLKQAVALFIFRYLCMHGFAKYEDRGSDKFGGWLWLLCYRVCGRIFERHAKRCKSTESEFGVAVEIRGLELSLLRAGDQLSDARLERAKEVALAAIRKMDGNLREVMQDHFRRVSRKASALRLGVTANYVSKLRRRGLDEVLRAFIDDGLT